MTTTTSAAGAKKPEPKPGILDINIYKAGASKIEGIEHPAKLSSNETPLGPSPRAREAYLEAAIDLERYPDPAATELKQVLAAHNKIDAERIVVGAGSDELLQLIAHAYVGAGSEVIYTEHSFVVYRLVTKANGASGVEIAEQDHLADVDAILAAITDKTSVIYLANPNNPTGTYLPASEINRLLEGIPSHVLLVLDEAYAEYVEEPDYASGLGLVDTHENVVVTRTFSKIYGLAALRLGWAYCPAAVADVLNRVRGPFNTNKAAQVAGIAAVKDQDHVAKAREHNAKWMRWLEQQLGGLGIDYTPSVGNFILMHFPDEPGKTAADVNAFLLSRGYILRAAPAPNLTGSLRLSIGLEDENRGLIEALEDFKKTR